MGKLDKELQVCLQAIRTAGAEVMRIYATFPKIADAPVNICTEADLASQEIILQTLHTEFPDDGLCGEESTPTLKEGKATSRRLWVVDPIDGTRGFARKNDEFSLMIGLVIDEIVTLGAVYEPAIDRVTYAVAGQGCWWRQPFDSEAKSGKATKTPKLADAVFGMSRSQGAEGEKTLLAAFGARQAVQTYSAGIKMAQVARGETDIYVGDYLTFHDWDICAGHILVEEAGGTVTTLTGKPIRYVGDGNAVRGEGTLASNGPLHEAGLAILASGAFKVK